MILDAQGITTAQVALGACDLSDAAFCEVLLLGQLQEVLAETAQLTGFPRSAVCWPQMLL